MLPNSPALLPRNSTVVRPQFAGALTAYTAKFTFQRLAVPVSGSNATLIIPADSTRVGLLITGSGSTVTVDTGSGMTAVFLTSTGVPLGTPLNLNHGTDFDIVASQQQWALNVPAGQWATVYTVSALPG